MSSRRRFWDYSPGSAAELQIPAWISGWGPGSAASIARLLPHQSRNLSHAQRNRRIAGARDLGLRGRRLARRALAGSEFPSSGKPSTRSPRKRYQCGNRQSPRLLFPRYYDPPFRMEAAQSRARMPEVLFSAGLLGSWPGGTRHVSIIPPRGRPVAAVLRDRAGTDQSTARSAFHGLRSGKGGCAVSASRRDRDSGPG